MSNIAITYLNNHLLPRAQKLSEQLNLPIVDSTDKDHICLLCITPEHLELRLTGEKRLGSVYVDFLAGALAHRYRFGGGKNQAIAKAVGLSKKSNIKVLDVTAGLGRDAFLLAYLGCNVTMLERSPIVSVLLEDGLNRARQETWVEALLLELKKIDAKDYLKELTSEHYPEVIYLDPMFPDLGKSALVKKEMRVLRKVVGDDQDVVELFELALQYAKQRVVVKRARLAPPLTSVKPDLVLTGKANRFDVYCLSGF